MLCLHSCVIRGPGPVQPLPRWLMLFWRCFGVQGPLYINPLMGFIDEKCMIFTSDEENKFEYTAVSWGARSKPNCGSIN